MSSRSVSTSTPSPGEAEAGCLPATERMSRRISGTESSSSRARRGPICTSSARFHTDVVPVRASVSGRAFPDTRREDAPTPVDQGLYSWSTRYLRGRGTRHIAQFAFGVQPVVNIVAVLATSITVPTLRARSRIAVTWLWRRLHDHWCDRVGAEVRSQVRRVNMASRRTRHSPHARRVLAAMEQRGQ